jgi:hypothetical protein
VSETEYVITEYFFFFLLTRIMPQWPVTVSLQRLRGLPRDFCLSDDDEGVIKGAEMRTVQPLLLNCHPHLLAAHPDSTNEALATELQRYNCFIPYRGNAVLNACPEASR